MEPDQHVDRQTRVAIDHLLSELLVHEEVQKQIQNRSRAYQNNENADYALVLDCQKFRVFHHKAERY